MRILVTGGAGFIGSNFIRLLLASEPTCSVINFDKLTYAGNLENLRSVSASLRYQFVKGDICDRPVLDAVMAECTAVVHFAAESHVDRSIYDPSPAVQTNVTGTFSLLEAARKLGIARFIHVSTDEVYGDILEGQFADETFPLRPSSPYSATKAASDLLVSSYIRTYGFPAIITRSSNNYGPYQFPEKFIPLIIFNALQNKTLPVYGDGKQQRDWLHVEDNCRAILKVLSHGALGQVYNIGGVGTHENLDIVRTLLRLTGKSEKLISYVKDRPGHDRRYALNCNKITSELKWNPEIGFEAGLAQTIDWYKSNLDWLDSILAGDYLSYYEKYYVNRETSLQAITAQISRV